MRDPIREITMQSPFTSVVLLLFLSIAIQAVPTVAAMEQNIWYRSDDYSVTIVDGQAKRKWRYTVNADFAQAAKAEKYRQEIRSTIRHELYELLKTKKRGTQGKTVVDFNIGSQGELSNIRLVTPSGDKQFDAYLMSLLKERSYFRPLNSLLGKHLNVQVCAICEDFQTDPKAKLPDSIKEAHATALMNSSDWKNPYLVINADHSLNLRHGKKTETIEIFELAASLSGFPPAEWPLGKVIAVQINGVGGATASDRTEVENILKSLGLKLMPFPSA